MTTAEKKNKIREFCVGAKCDETGCPLFNTTFSDGGICIQNHDNETDINEMYRILNDACYDCKHFLKCERINKDICDQFKKVAVFACEDVVNHPKHYADGKIEVIDFIEDKKLGFCLGNAVKYIARAGKKDPTKEVEDLKKARWYIERRIKEIEEDKQC